MTWDTTWGQQVETEPRPYLDNPGAYGPAPPAASDDGGDHDDTGPPGIPPHCDDANGADDSDGDEMPLPFEGSRRGDAAPTPRSTNLD